MNGVCSIGAGGAVRLGGAIVADGFDSDAQVRVQTHVHGDHLAGFDSSKGNGLIVCSQPTRDLLIATRSRFLRFAANVIPIELGQAWMSPGGSAVTLLDARHMSGSTQVLVEHADGTRTAYSGDFFWPCEPPDRPDELVLDATYGTPGSVRKYSQADAEARFVDEALARLKTGPVTVKAHRGTLQRAIALLGECTTMPMLGTAGQCAESAVWAAYGHAQATLVDVDCPEGVAAVATRRYVLFYGTGDRLPDLQPGEHRITLSAFGAPELDPYLAISERHVRVALSDHADFDGTLEYVATSKPKAVLTDASRSPHAAVLAEQITSRLGIPARPVEADTSALGRGWA